MATSLISKLHDLQHLNPDEIVAKINKRGWVQPHTMTHDQIMDWDQELVRISMYPQCSGSVFQLNAHNWAYLAGGDLSDWWFCLQSEWDGSVPCQN